jgi:SAM-dependent methyltransferase
MPMTSRYDDVVPGLRTWYDSGAADRDGRAKQQFKLDERAVFLDRLHAVEAKSLLEIGAGTGEDAVAFRDEGLDVVAVDLSPVSVARCRAKGLEAYERDFLHLGFEPESFDAVYAMNCLLHVPNADLPQVLAAVRTVLRPGGLFYVGLWGGESTEGVWADDHQEPKRFFALRTDEEVFGYVREIFEVLDFHTVAEEEPHFQSITLVRPVEWGGGADEEGPAPRSAVQGLVVPGGGG